jgi:hypothetical protein
VQAGWPSWLATRCEDFYWALSNLVLVVGKPDGCGRRWPSAELDCLFRQAGVDGRVARRSSDESRLAQPGRRRDQFRGIYLGKQAQSETS